MDAHELQDELDTLIKRRNRLYGRCFVWGFVLLGTLPLPRLMTRIAPGMFFVALTIIAGTLAVTGLLLLARIISVWTEIREVKASLKHAKAKNQEVVAHYEISDDGELVEVIPEDNHEKRLRK